MAKYLIHTCAKRKWYVDNFLVPSMLKQGIERENIMVFNDDAKMGNLKSFIASASWLDTTVSGTWHLQDDIIISSKFRDVTEAYNKGIVCGFCSRFCSEMPIGIRPVRDMWYSFPCIRIPNIVLKGFIQWLNSASVQNKYKYYIEANKFDDSLFRNYILEVHSDKVVHNVCPNIVDHVDYLVGGSIINYTRGEKNTSSIYFNEKDLITELKQSIENSVYKRN